MAKPMLPEADKVLWQQQMQGIALKPKQARHKRKRQAAPIEEPAPPPPAPKTWQTLAWDAPPPAKPPSLPQHAPTPLPPLNPVDPQQFSKIRRRKRAIDGQLDLHHLSQNQAHQALQRFLATALANQWRTLLIVTGKSGGKASHTSILRRLLPEWLTAAPLAQLLRRHKISLTAAAPHHGGEGAFYLLLKERDP